MRTFEFLESSVRRYCRAFPTVFTTACGSRILDEGGRQYIDFFAGAGTLNYGHNHPRFKKKLVDYLGADGITHSLDMATASKREFLERFHATILEPRGLDYLVQFTGPTGTNAVEAALKLVRKATGRTTVVHFTHAFHGMTLGSLSVGGDRRARAAAGVPLGHTVEMPFDEGPRADVLRQYLGTVRGAELPAAIIVETVQAEGGVRVASFDWLRDLAGLARQLEVLLIVDDIQVGCGRTGKFFSFEDAGIEPDVVCLSKSLSGFGLPMAVVLYRRDLDCWEPGEHTGTFRGLNLAFVTATEALEYWRDASFTRAVEAKSRRVRGRLESIASRHGDVCRQARGRGLIQGLALAPGVAVTVAAAAFERGLIIETSGPANEVLKLLPPLVIDDEDLDAGLDIIEESLLASARPRAGRSWAAFPEPEAVKEAGRSG